MWRTLHEWGRVPYGDNAQDTKTIPSVIAGRLAAAARQSTFAGKDGDRVLDDRRTELRACGVVGVVVADSCVLEILPKIDVGGESDEARNSSIRRRLIHMLAVAYDLPIDVGMFTALDWQNNTLLEILIRVFSQKLADAVRMGMPRRYQSLGDDLPTLRGALNITRQFTKHAANPSILACRFDTLTKDIALNRIMKAAVVRLARLAQSPDNQSRLRDLTYVYADIADVPVPALRWADVVLDRTNERWRDLLGMARLLLDGQYQSSSYGLGQGFALLFKMEVLFEAYVGRLVRKAFAGTGLTVELQGGRRYCLACQATSKLSFQTKPDILVKRGNDIVQIIDTKWKLISPREPEWGIKQADVYQMMAYGQLYHCPMVTLLYPHRADLGSQEGYLGTYRVVGTAQNIQVASVDVARGDNLLLRLRSIFCGVDNLDMVG